MFIHKAVDKLDSLGLGFTLYNSILNSNCKFTFTTFHMDMWWIMVKGIDINLLFKSSNNWTERQKERASILFEEYSDIKQTYGLCHSLRMIFSKNSTKDAARLSMARWYNKVDEAGLHSFNVIAATFYEHYDDILNFTTIVLLMLWRNLLTLKSNSLDLILEALSIGSFSFSESLNFLLTHTK